MSFVKTGLFGLLLFVCAAHTSAQNVALARNDAFPKPKLFNDLPNRIKVDMPLLAPLLQKEVGAPVHVVVSAGFVFDGVVVSKSDATEPRYKTVVIRATNRPGATFAITGVRKNDGTYRYSGRMLSLKSSDAYELVEENGAFALQKREAAELVTE